MNIVIIGPFGLRPRTTMGVRALPMAEALAARGHVVTMLLPPWRNPEDAGRSWEENGVAVENIPLPPRIPGLFHLLTALRLVRRVQALRPDVVHLFKPKAYSGLSHWLLARLPRARRPWLVVDTDDWEGPGGWNEISGYTPAQRRFFAWQERWGLTHADAVTVASRALESIVWALGVPSPQVFYVPNGALSSQHVTRNMQHATRNTQPIILLYTRFFEFPVSRVIEVLNRVRERIPGVRLLVVGEGLFGEEEELFHLAAQSGLIVQRDVSIPLSPCLFAPLSSAESSAELSAESSADILYAGWVSPADLPTYFAQADVAIYPFDDTLVNRTKCAVKLRDLLAAGVPVVAEAVGQNREMIRHGETGWLVDPGDVDSFVEAVVRLLEDVQLRVRLGQAAARDMRGRLAWERLVETVERAYQVDGGER